MRESRINQVFDRLNSSGRITILSSESSIDLDREIEKGFRKIRTDYEIKERLTMINIANLELKYT